MRLLLLCVDEKCMCFSVFQIHMNAHSTQTKSAPAPCDELLLLPCIWVYSICWLKAAQRKICKCNKCNVIKLSLIYLYIFLQTQTHTHTLNTNKGLAKIWISFKFFILIQLKLFRLNKYLFEFFLLTILFYFMNYPYNDEKWKPCGCTNV